MAAIARDGDLGDLGRDRMGDAATGVSEEVAAEFRTALTKLDEALAELASARQDASKAAKVVTTWVEIGERALAVAEPFLKQWAGQRRQDSGVSKPEWKSGVETALGQLGTLQGRFSAFL